MDFTEMGSFSQQMAHERQIRQAQLGPVVCEALRQRRLERHAMRRERARSVLSILTLRRQSRVGRDPCGRLDLGGLPEAVVVTD